jgi:hypothetical protein
MKLITIRRDPISRFMIDNALACERGTLNERQRGQAPFPTSIVIMAQRGIGAHATTNQHALETSKLTRGIGSSQFIDIAECQYYAGFLGRKWN